MLSVPPGPVFIARRLPNIVLPSLLTYGALNLLERNGTLRLPTWVVVPLVLIAKPVYYGISLYRQRISYWWRARKRGAKVVPHVEEPWPYFAGISIIAQLEDDWINGYVGEYPLYVLRM